MHWCEGARLVFWSASRLTRVDGALRALSLWNALVRGGSSGFLVGYPAHTGRRGTPARRGASGTRGGSDRASRLVVWVRLVGYFHFHVTRSGVLPGYFQFWSVPGHGTSLRGSGTTEAGGLLGQMSGGPAQVASYGWLGNLWSLVSAGADFILGPAWALPILVGAWSWDLTPWSGNSRSWWYARADVRWSYSGCLVRLARVFLVIHPSPTLVGIPWQGASFLLHGPGTSGVRRLQGQISSWVLLGHFQFCSTWVTGKFYPGQQAWYLGKFYPGHGEVLPGTTMSSDAEVAGCSMIRLELGSRGPGYPGYFARPWLEWSVARGASVSFGCWKGGFPPSSAKMLMPKTLPAVTPNVVGWSDHVWPVAPPQSLTKRTHLGMMETTVWCLPRALRCLCQFES
ncbi:hypothetical protein TIFTF001_054497 [Ficus carica]|uniref:Uncharacterized protein n=1 Tax=Ficus carica TaxID=3494 RepID=A0AA88JJQ6_FICCA|nr:hypothetical protein TIFTF001_054497 [Ficus carica]